MAHLEHSTKGRLGDIRGKPTAEQLQVIKDDSRRIGKLLYSVGDYLG